MPAPIVESGARYGRLVVGNRVPRRGAAYWDCRCDCGRVKVVTGWSLRSGNTQSCGCLKKERVAAATATHRDKGSPEHTAWRNMISRCTNAKRDDYARYGGRGIKVCGRWRGSYEAFLSDMGRKPSPAHSIDRIDGDGDYEPGNCRWATAREQNGNRSVCIYLDDGGETVWLSEYCRRHSLPYKSIARRLKRGTFAPAFMRRTA